MTPEEIIKVLREVDADAKASEGDYYADQFAWHGAGEIADAVEQMAAEIARLREERRSISTLLGKVETLEADNAKLREERLTFCTVEGFPGKFATMPLPPGPEARG